MLRLMHRAEIEVTRQTIGRVDSLIKVRYLTKLAWHLINDAIELFDAVLQIVIESALTLDLDVAIVWVGLTHGGCDGMIDWFLKSIFVEFPFFHSFSPH